MTVKMSVRILSLFFLALGCSMVSTAQRPGAWEYLGDAHVDGGADHDKIHVDNPGTFRAIQIEVVNGAIEFERVVVHFENGADHDVRIKARLRAGERSRVIDLPGDRRKIHSVEFWYVKANWGANRPHLKLYGRR
jgi:hypothetical protein